MATISLSGPTLLKAGAGVSAVMTADANLEVESFIDQAEAVVSCMSRYDWVTNYAGLDANIKLILEDIVSSLAAVNCIAYDLAGYTSRIEGEDMINVQRDIALRGLSLLRNQKVVTFINGA